MNREQRRHPEKLEEPGQRDPKENSEREVVANDRNQDEFSVRAKNTGHKKKTADKWNQ
jgi:hypothetical protein